MVEKKNTYVEANREIKDGFHMNEGTEWIWFVFFCGTCISDLCCWF